MFSSRVVLACRRALALSNVATGHGGVIHTTRPPPCTNGDLFRCYDSGFSTRCQQLTSRIASRTHPVPTQQLPRTPLASTFARQDVGKGGGRAPFTRAGAMRFAFASHHIDPTNVFVLRQFVTRGGRIKPRRITGLSAKLQRKVSRAIKRARSSGLMSPVRR